MRIVEGTRSESGGKGVVDDLLLRCEEEEVVVLGSMLSSNGFL